MSSSNDNNQELSGSGLAFSRYAEEELARRRDSCESFDEEDYNEVVAIVLRKLKMLREEGLR